MWKKSGTSGALQGDSLEIVTRLDKYQCFLIVYMACTMNN